jgi:hypothetical protein
LRVEDHYRLESLVDVPSLGDQGAQTLNSGLEWVIQGQVFDDDLEKGGVYDGIEWYFSYPRSNAVE